MGKIAKPLYRAFIAHPLIALIGATAGITGTATGCALNLNFAFFNPVVERELCRFFADIKVRGNITE